MTVCFYHGQGRWGELFEPDQVGERVSGLHGFEALMVRLRFGIEALREFARFGIAALTACLRCGP